MPTHEFSYFSLSDALPHPTGVEQVSGCVVLRCLGVAGLKPHQGDIKKKKLLLTFDDRIRRS